MVEVSTVATLTEAVSQLGPGSRYMAGGTLVMRGVNYGDQSFSRIVQVRGQDLTSIAREGDGIRIGAAVTMAQIIAARETELLAPVARAVGGPAIRNMATVGGNLFAPHPYGDFAVGLLALEAEVRFADGASEDLAAVLAKRQSESRLVESVSFRHPAMTEFRFLKVSRVKPKGASVLSMAAAFGRQGGRISNARIAYGAMAEAPVRVRAVEQALEGASLDERGIGPALAVAADGLSPPDDALASAWYRKEVAPVHLKRLLLSGARP